MELIDKFYYLCKQTNFGPVCLIIFLLLGLKTDKSELKKSL